MKAWKPPGTPRPRALTERELLFAAEYVKTGNKGRSAKLAGYPTENEGHRLLTRENVAKAILELVLASPPEAVFVGFRGMCRPASDLRKDKVVGACESEPDLRKYKARAGDDEATRVGKARVIGAREGGGPAEKTGSCAGASGRQESPVRARTTLLRKAQVCGRTRAGRSQETQGPAHAENLGPCAVAPVVLDEALLRKARVGSAHDHGRRRRLSTRVAWARATVLLLEGRSTADGDASRDRGQRHRASSQGAPSSA